MKYYYIDTPEKPIIDVFVPRIPVRRMSEENVEIPRICLSTSIEGCFTAAPWGSECLSDRPSYAVYRVYEFDGDKIPKNHIFTTEKLTKEEFVPDAKYTNETWIIEQNLIPDDMYYIILDDYETGVVGEEESNYDFYEVIKNADIREVEDVIFITELSFEDNNPTIESSWINYILECFSYFFFREVDIEKKGEDTKIIFPRPHVFAMEHLEKLSQIMDNTGVTLKYR